MRRNVHIPFYRDGELRKELMAVGFPPAIINGHLITRQEFGNSFYCCDTTVQRLYYGLPQVISISLEKEAVVKEVLPFPQYYRMGHFYGSSRGMATFNRNSKKIIYSFPDLNQVFVLDPDLEYESIEAGSKYFEQKLTPLPPDSMMSRDFVAKYRVTHGEYVNLIYDEYADLYYRVYKHPDEYLSADGYLNDYLDAPWSIVILDRDINVIGEHLFPPESYDFNLILPTSKGLLVSNNHPLSSLFDPDRLSFTLFEIKTQQ